MNTQSDLNKKLYDAIDYRFGRSFKDDDLKAAASACEKIVKQSLLQEKIDLLSYLQREFGLNWKLDKLAGELTEQLNNLNQ